MVVLYSLPLLGLFVALLLCCVSPVLFLCFCVFVHRAHAMKGTSRRHQAAHQVRAGTTMSWQAYRRATCSRQEPHRDLLNTHEIHGGIVFDWTTNPVPIELCFDRCRNWFHARRREVGAPPTRPPLAVVFLQCRRYQHLHLAPRPTRHARTMPTRTPVITVKRMLPEFRLDTFDVDTNVFAQSKNGWYHARVLAVRTTTGTAEPKTEYQVHFHGWNRNYDSWMEADKLIDQRAVLSHIKRADGAAAAKRAHSRAQKAGCLILLVDPGRDSEDTSESEEDNSDDEDSASDEPQPAATGAQPKKKKITKGLGGARGSRRVTAAQVGAKRKGSTKRTAKTSKRDPRRPTTKTKNGSKAKARKVIVKPKLNVKGKAKGKRTKRGGAGRQGAASRGTSSHDSGIVDDDDDDDDDVGNGSGEDAESGGGSGATRLEIKFPNPLKKQLIADWTFVSKEQLVPLPRKLSVREVLKRYRQSKTTKHTSRRIQQATAAKDFATGLEHYFDRTLPRMLLYSFERLQYHDSRSRYRGRAPSELCVRAHTNTCNDTRAHARAHTHTHTHTHARTHTASWHAFVGAAFAAFGWKKFVRLTAPHLSMPTPTHSFQ